MYKVLILLNLIIGSVASNASGIPQNINEKILLLDNEAQKTAYDDIKKIKNYSDVANISNHGKIVIADYFKYDSLNNESYDLPHIVLTLEETNIINYLRTNIYKLHSLPNATYVFYLNFRGGDTDIRNTYWNSPGEIYYPYSFSIDNIYDMNETSLLDIELIGMYNIWQRVSEDYSPWQIDITTEPPKIITNKMLIAMITKNIDRNNKPMPFHTAAGIAVFDILNYKYSDFYSPALIYYNKLGIINNGIYYSLPNVAEATSHELGHNLGLSHDGYLNNEYWNGIYNENLDISYGAIMGTAYGRSITKFVINDYPGANNNENDL